MGKYLHYFSTKADYIKKYFSDEYEKHWTSLTTPGYKSNYDRTKKKLEKTPLTTVPLTNDSTTFTFAIAANVNTDTLESISYSVDGGETWVTTLNVNATAVNITATVTNKTPVMWKGVGKAISVSDSVYSRLYANKNFEAAGNPLSLIGERYNLKSLVNNEWALAQLFIGATTLIKADELVLSAKKMGLQCYRRMFSGCTNLETYPELPAISLAGSCYAYMFENCKKMITPPVLPALKLNGTYCYAYMFSGCTGLTSIPELPAMNLAQYCYQRMFSGCTGLVDCEINLPAITMATGSYDYMFYGCNKLTTVPELPATSLAPFCYEYMFGGCAITTIPLLPATKLEDQCYKYMFYNCKGLTDLSEHTFPVITSGGNAYVYMFSGCSNLTKAPVLPTLTLTGNYFYRGMFQNCTSLIQAPELPATVGKPYCYMEMFIGCTSLTTMPTIHLNTLPGVSCFQGMFSGCTSLVNVMDILPWTTLQNACFSNMFNGCTSLVTAPKLPAKTLLANCYNSMFKNCTNLNSVTALFTTEPNSVTTCNANWLSGVSSTGTFTMSATAEWDPDDYRNVNGIPEGWTVNKINPTLSINDGKVTYDVPSSGIQITIVGTNLIADYTFTLDDPDEVFTVTESNLDDTYNVTCSDHTVLHTAILTFSSPGAVNLTLTLMNNIGTIPNTYKRVSYVEADGNQQVDLNLNMFGTVPVDYGVQFMGYLNSTSVQYASLLANTKETSPYYGTAIRRDSSTNNVQYRANQTNTVISAINKVFTINYTGTENNAFDCKTTLFSAINTTNGSWWRPAIGRIYVCKIIMNNTVVRNLLPCVEISTDTAGLYDTVNNVFYTSETEPLTYVD